MEWADQLFVGVVLPIASTVLMGFIGAAAVKLREKWNIELTVEAKDSVHSALINAMVTIFTKHVSQGKDLSSISVRSAAELAADMVRKSNPGQIKTIGATKDVLVNVAIARASEAIMRSGLTEYGSMSEVVSPTARSK